MSTSSDQVARLLALVPYLQAHPGVAVTEAARTFGVSRAQLMRDLQVLWMCGLPGGLPDDLIEIDMDAATENGTIHLTNAEYLSRPMRFTLDEVMSLVVALRTVAEVATGPTAAAVASALGKLEALTSASETNRVALQLATGTELVRRVLVHCIDNRRRAALVYDGLTRGQTSRPEVDPARIDLVDGVAYLQAWSHERSAWRTYRLDRIVEARIVDRPAGEHGPAPEARSGWFDGSDQQVTLSLAPEAAWVTEYYPMVDTATEDSPTVAEDSPTVADDSPTVADDSPTVTGDSPTVTGDSPTVAEPVEAMQDDRIIATFPVTDPNWLRHLLLRLGGGARVLEPADAGADAASAALEALALNEAVFGA